MAHNTLVRASLAAWNADATVTAAEFWKLDENQYKSINGDDGGTWAPLAAIIIGGAGMEVTGPLLVSDCQTLEMTQGDINVYAAARLRILNGGVLDMLGGAVCNVESGADIIVKSGAEIEVRSGGLVDAQAGSTIAVFGDLDIESGGGVSVKTGATFATVPGATVNLGADTTQLGKLIRSGVSGRTVSRVSTMQTNVSFDATVAQDIWLAEITDGSNRTVTCRTTSTVPQTGEVLFIRKIGTGGILTINSEGPTAICQIGPGNAGGASLFFDGTRWRLKDFWETGVHIFSGA